MATFRSALAIVREIILDQILGRRLTPLERDGVLDDFLKRPTPDHQT